MLVKGEKTMVLPLIIGGVVVLGVAGIALSGGFSGIGSALDRVTKSDERKDFELQKEKHDFSVSKRGLFGYIFTLGFGEEQYQRVFKPNLAHPQAPLTGQPNQTPQQYQESQTFPNESKKVVKNG